jgi:hypothetical protein
MYEVFGSTYIPTYFLDMYHYKVCNLCIQTFLFYLRIYVRAYFDEENGMSCILVV